MDLPDRLAARLAGELDADERAAFEAELARDPELRAALAAMQRADQELAELSSPEPPEGFEDRLDAAVRGAVDEVLGGTAPDAAATAGPDAITGRAGPAGSTVVGEDALARRRRDRRERRMRVVTGVAAGAILLVGGGVLLNQIGMGGGDDAAFTTSMDDSGDAGMDADQEEAAEDEAAMESIGPMGPSIVADERDLDDDALDALLQGEEITSLRADGVDPQTGRDLAARFQAALGAIPAPGDGGGGDETPAEDAPTAEADDAADTEVTEEGEDGGAAGEGAVELVTRDGRRLPDEAADDVARCLGELLQATPDAIPVYAELGSYDGVDAIIFGLVTLDPTTERFSRGEVWAVARTDCQVLRFSQG